MDSADFLLREDLSNDEPRYPKREAKSQSYKELEMPDMDEFVCKTVFTHIPWKIKKDNTFCLDVFSFQFVKIAIPNI